MSAARDGIEPGSAPRPSLYGYLTYVRGNIAAYFLFFARSPRAVVCTRSKALPAIAALAAVIVAILLTMSWLDAWSVSVAHRLPAGLVGAFDTITDYGRSGWFLIPIGLMIVLIALVCTPSLPAMSQRVLAALAVRLGFLFTAILLPGLVFTIVKRLIGRARPLVGGSLDPFLYRPLHWNVEYASLPSGHAINAFAVATALGLLWPKMRPVLWAYAVTIAASRVALTAHYPSDVLAGAIIGVAGTVLIRSWFAARSLVFLPASDGRIRPMSGPSFARIGRVARQLIAP
ncbi:MAG TPA: phosphatase PAP2 family protein [Xanthobacteraceae bacterium]